MSVSRSSRLDRPPGGLDVEVGVGPLDVRKGGDALGRLAVDHDHVLEVGQLLARLEHAVEVRLLDQRHPRPGVGDQVLDLLGCVGLIDRERDGPERHGREIADVKLRPVAEHQRDGVALAHPQLGESAGERVRALAHLTPGDRDAVVAVAQRDVVGLLLGGDAECLGDGRGIDRALAGGLGGGAAFHARSSLGIAPRGNATAGASARVGTSGGEVGSGGAALRARALVPGEPGLTHRDQRARDQTDLPAVRVGLHVPGAASLLHDRGLHSLFPTGPFALSARPPASL